MKIHPGLYGDRHEGCGFIVMEINGDIQFQKCNMLGLKQILVLEEGCQPIERIDCQIDGWR